MRNRDQWKWKWHVLTWICEFTENWAVTQRGIKGHIKSSLKTQQRSLVFGTCFDDSNIIISHYEYTVKIYKTVCIQLFQKRVAPVIHDVWCMVRVS